MTFTCATELKCKQKTTKKMQKRWFTVTLGNTTSNIASNLQIVFYIKFERVKIKRSNLNRVTIFYIGL